MLKIGVVGMGIGGAHGATVHKSGLAEFTAICDKDPEKIKFRLESYPKEIDAHPRGYTDLDEMCAKEKLDGLIISTPSGMHHQQVAIGARHGVNLLIDKPVDITAEHMEAIAQAVAKAGVLCGVNHSMRFENSYWAVKDAIDAGEFGKLLLVDARLKWFRDQAYYDRGGWRATWAMDGGGSLMNQGVHMMDMLVWLASGKPKATRGDFAAINHKIETEDWASAVVEFDNGVRSTISTTTCVFPKDDRTFFDVHGTAGSAFLVNGKIVETNIESLKNPKPAPAANAIIDFLEAIGDQRLPAIPVEQARRPVELILATYKSAREKKTVQM